MLSLLLFWIGALIRLFRSRGNLVLENLMLRQQLAVLKRRHPRPSLGPFDKLFWVIARRVIARRGWADWKESLIIRSEERRVGEEGRSRGWPEHLKKKKKINTRAQGW